MLVNTIDRIVVTGDVLRQRRTSGSSQNTNIEWLYHQVRPALRLLTDLPVSSLLFTGDANCLGTQIYQSNRLPVAYDSWVRLFNRRPGSRELGLIWSRLDGSLVIGFELPEILRLGLEAVRIPYVDFTVHPIRFLDDLAFGLRSNIPDLALHLQRHVLREAEILIGAGQARSTLVKMPRLPLCAEGERIGLFAGQTADDKVLIEGDRFLGSDDFLDQFAALSAAHETLLVKPHPLVQHSSTALTLSRLFPNVSLVDANFYHLLSHDSISDVYSITSSTSIEARYFDKRGVHLHTYPYVFSEASAADGNYLSIHPDFFLPDFWAEVLGQVGCEYRQIAPLRVFPQRSRMRQTLRSYWGAKIFEEAQ